MKIYTSYFYQIRFFEPYMIPLSTAMFDPSWYHDFKGNGYVFKDKRGVYNGLRADPFVPGKSCENLCRGPENCQSKDSKSCNFLKKYREQLDQYDFNLILDRFNNLGNKIIKRDGLKIEPIFVLIFHETPTNPCSERWVVQDWFRANGMNVEEITLKGVKKNGVPKPDIW